MNRLLLPLLLAAGALAVTAAPAAAQHGYGGFGCGFRTGYATRSLYGGRVGGIRQVRYIQPVRRIHPLSRFPAYRYRFNHFSYPRFSYGFGYRPLYPAYGPVVYRPIVYRPVVYRPVVYRPAFYSPVIYGYSPAYGPRRARVRSLWRRILRSLRDRLWSRMGRRRTILPAPVLLLFGGRDRGPRHVVSFQPDHRRRVVLTAAIVTRGNGSDSDDRVRQNPR